MKHDEYINITKYREYLKVLFPSMVEILKVTNNEPIEKKFLTLCV